MGCIGGPVVSVIAFNSDKYEYKQKEVGFGSYLQEEKIYSGINCLRVDKAYWTNKPENTHILCKGKYHCTADLLFYWFAFSCFSYVELDTDFQVWSTPNQSSMRSVVQWYFPFISKWVFSAKLSPLPDIFSIATILNRNRLCILTKKVRDVQLSRDRVGHVGHPRRRELASEDHRQWVEAALAYQASKTVISLFNEKRFLWLYYLTLFQERVKSDTKKFRMESHRCRRVATFKTAEEGNAKSERRREM